MLEMYKTKRSQNFYQFLSFTFFHPGLFCYHKLHLSQKYQRNSFVENLFPSLILTNFVFFSVIVDILTFHCYKKTNN